MYITQRQPLKLITIKFVLNSLLHLFSCVSHNNSDIVVSRVVWTSPNL